MGQVHQRVHDHPHSESFAVNARKALFWGTTSFIALETLAGGVTDLARGREMLVAGRPVADVVTGLGYPVYILTILGILKVPAAVVLLAPGWRRLKEWAYAGIAFELLGAAASFLLHGHDFGDASTPLILAGIAFVSWALRAPERRLGSHAVEQHESGSSLV